MNDDPQSLEPFLAHAGARPGERDAGRALAAGLPEAAGRAAAGRAEPGEETLNRSAARARPRIRPGRG